mmetsp:Transcript_84242/g.239268  ORF Transcript_84242/g.239268 Transcript_84242/m.239268 type:complete len:201 (-) Transcript_84242:1142-1744(-)
MNRLTDTQCHGDWGLAQWAPHLVSMLMDSSASSTDLLIQLMISRAQYYRLDSTMAPRDGASLALDDVKSIPLMIEMANDVDIDDAVEFVTKYFLGTSSARLAHKRAHLYDGMDGIDEEDAWSRARAEFNKRGQAQEHAQAQAEPQRRASEGPEPPSEGEGAWGDSWTEGMREGKKHASEQIDEVDYAWEQFARSHTHDHL